MIRRFRSALTLTLLVGAVVVGIGLPAGVHGADLHPSYQCLPEETVAVVRLPEARKFVDAFRGQTKLGNVLLSNRRFEGVVDLIREQAGDNLNEFTSALAKYNLKIEDFPKLFDNELGYAIVVEPRGKETPLVVGLGWLEPEGDLGTRILAALEQAVKEDSEGDVRRVDFSIDGQEVTQLTFRVMGAGATPDFDFSELQGLDPDQIRAKLAERREQAEANQVEVDQTYLFITRLGNRLLMGHTFATSESKVRALRGEDAEKQIDFAEIAGLEPAKGVFARFIAAHTGSPATLTPRVMATPGLAASLPEGTPLVEALFMPEVLFKMARENEGDEVTRVLKMLGVDRLGPMAFRMVLDRGALRSGFFASAPAPRDGLLALIDQPSITPDPPSWVPATVMGFGQISFDLGKAYALVRDMALAEGGDSAKDSVQQLEQQVEQVSGVGLEALLSSVGSNHYFLMYTPTMTKVTKGEVEAELPVSRSGIVWQLKDEAPWKRLIQLGAGFAGLSKGAITATEEQGFIGLRAKELGDALTGGVFVGHGFMILGIGPDVVEPLMSAVRTPLEGEAAFRGSELVKRASALEPAEACIFYRVLDFDRYLKVVRQAFISAFDSATQSIAGRFGGNGNVVVEQSGPDEDTVKQIEKVKALLPTDEELEGTTGASVGRLLINQHGLIYQSALELPPQ